MTSPELKSVPPASVTTLTSEHSVLKGFAVVIPVFNGAEYLPQILPTVKAASCRPRVLVVNDASTDGTDAVARSFDVEVLTLEKRRGPAGARNFAVEHLEEEVILFLDADCVPQPKVIDKVYEEFANDPTLVSLTGSYDSSPSAAGFFSQYMNLRHHFFHQRARRDDATFWAGFGAVRRDAFLESGGFDQERFPTPQIEDIELGLRLRRLGSARLDPELQVKHLKKWSLRSVVKTDVLNRGVPWSRLVLESGQLPNDLNLQWSQRLAALLAPLTLMAIFATPWALVTGRWALVVTAALLVMCSGFLNAQMIRTFSRLRGPGFATGAGLFHQLHLSYSGATFALCALAYFSDRDGAAKTSKRSLARVNPSLHTLLTKAFARYDPVALGVAIASLGSAGLLLATVVLLLRGGDPLGPSLSLLGNYFLGYTVSWPGAVIGLAESSVAGFVFGYVLASLLNILVSGYEHALLRQLDYRADGRG